MFKINLMPAMESGKVQNVTPKRISSVSSFEEGFDYAYKTYKETGRVRLFRIQKYGDSVVDLANLITARTFDAVDTDEDTAKAQLKLQATKVFQNCERSMPKIREAVMKKWYDIEDDDYDRYANPFGKDIRKKATRDQVKSGLVCEVTNLDFVSKSQIDVTMYIGSPYEQDRKTATIRVKDLVNGLYKSVNAIDYFYF